MPAMVLELRKQLQTLHTDILYVQLPVQYPQVHSLQRKLSSPLFREGYPTHFTKG